MRNLQPHSQQTWSLKVSGFAKFESCPEQRNIFPMYFVPVTPKTKSECRKSDTCCSLDMAHTSFVNGAFISFRTGLYALIKMATNSQRPGAKKKKKGLKFIKDCFLQPHHFKIMFLTIFSLCHTSHNVSNDSAHLPHPLSDVVTRM